MMKLNGHVIMIFCLSFLVLLVCHECSKIDVNDIKSIASAPCKADCQRTIQSYCCCGDDSNAKFCRSEMMECHKMCIDYEKYVENNEFLENDEVVEEVKRKDCELLVPFYNF
nr:hypothetical protein [Tanacetum cinerariifolium]